MSVDRLSVENSVSAGGEPTESPSSEPRLFDCVELVDDVLGWKRGTPCTVIEVFGDGHLLVEVDNDYVDWDTTSLLDACLDVPSSMARTRMSGSVGPRHGVSSRLRRLRDER